MPDPAPTSIALSNKKKLTILRDIKASMNIATVAARNQVSEHDVYQQMLRFMCSGITATKAHLNTFYDISDDLFNLIEGKMLAEDRMNYNGVARLKAECLDTFPNVKEEQVVLAVTYHHVKEYLKSLRVAHIDVETNTIQGVKYLVKEPLIKSDEHYFEPLASTSSIANDYARQRVYVQQPGLLPPQPNDFCHIIFNRLFGQDEPVRRYGIMDSEIMAFELNNLTQNSDSELEDGEEEEEELTQNSESELGEEESMEESDDEWLEHDTNSEASDSDDAMIIEEVATELIDLLTSDDELSSENSAEGTSNLLPQI